MGGSTGNDDYIVDTVADGIFEFAGEGVADRALVTVSGYTLAAEVEIGAVITAAGQVLDGNAADNVLFGNVGGDTLSGGGGDDQFSADAGDDRVNGGAGNDVMSGGLDLDTFVFDTALDAATNVDGINDYTVADDSFELDSAIFTALTAGGPITAAQFETGASATTADARIIYDNTTGDVFYDADGAGGTGQVQFARVSAGLAMTNADFLVV
jgi:Ca2+-binding RTX toxin-like protein